MVAQPDRAFRSTELIETTDGATASLQPKVGSPYLTSSSCLLTPYVTPLDIHLVIASYYIIVAFHFYVSYKLLLYATPYRIRDVSGDGSFCMGSQSRLNHRRLLSVIL